MLEYLIPLIPILNLYAAYTLSENNAYKTNFIYCFGYLPFIAYNVYIREFWQAGYFLINWVLAVKGVTSHIRIQGKSKPRSETNSGQKVESPNWLKESFLKCLKISK
jgi:hypothetical protein